MLLKWVYSRFYIEMKMFQNEKIKFKKILKKKCQWHDSKFWKSRFWEINYINVWKKREKIKLNIMMKSILFVFLMLKTTFY
jgi:hypothetical protein